MEKTIPFFGSPEPFTKGDFTFSPRPVCHGSCLYQGLFITVFIRLQVIALNRLVCYGHISHITMRWSATGNWIGSCPRTLTGSSCSCTQCHSCSQYRPALLSIWIFPTEFFLRFNRVRPTHISPFSKKEEGSRSILREHDI